MTNYQRTAKWLAACEKQPGDPGHLSTQIGVDLEETAELLQHLRVSKPGWSHLLERLVIDLQNLSAEIKAGKLTAYYPHHRRTAVLDAVCDREVTGNGLAWLMGFDKDAADAEVLRANDSKLVNGKPHLLPGGKIGKGPDYRPPQLELFAR